MLLASEELYVDSFTDIPFTALTLVCHGELGANKEKPSAFVRGFFLESS